MKPNTSKIVLAKVKAFSCDRSPQEHTLKVLSGGEVEVWDNIASAFTSCHSLSEEMMEKARNARPYQIIS